MNQYLTSFFEYFQKHIKGLIFDEIFCPLLFFIFFTNTFVLIETIIASLCGKIKTI